MKNHVKNTLSVFLVLSMTLLIISGCYEFDFVVQPHSAQSDTTFTVQISATTTHGNGQKHVPAFGIVLPVGWTVDDSIPFIHGGIAGTFIYSASATLNMDTLEPASPGYYWWVSLGADSVIYTINDTYLFNPVIHTNDQPGTFSLTYAIGYNGLLNHRIENHSITIGLPSFLEVTDEGNSGPGTLRNALDGIDYYGTISLNLAENDTIHLTEPLLVNKSVHIHNAGNWFQTISGDYQCGIFVINSCEPYLKGLRLIRGNSSQGGALDCQNAAPCFDSLQLYDNIAYSNGGGINCYKSDVLVRNVDMLRNSARFGGGISDCGSRLTLSDVRIIGNYSSEGGGGMSLQETECIFDSLYRCDIHSNVSSRGDEIYSFDSIHVVVDTFSVIPPNQQCAYPIENFSFDILHSKYNQANADLYVSPEGSNDNSGLTANDPLRTIHHAFKLMFADSVHPHTVFLQSGSYGVMDGQEPFPVQIPAFVHLSGAGDSLVTLDSEKQIGFNIENQGVKLSGITMNNSSVGISMHYCDPLIENVTLTQCTGDAIRCIYSNPVIRKVAIYNNDERGIALENCPQPILENLNISDQKDMGIAMFESNPSIRNSFVSNNYIGIKCSNSNPFILDSRISDNSAGGIICESSNPVIRNTDIVNNTADEGGGLLCRYSNPVIKNSRIMDNHAEKGGGVYCEYSYPQFMYVILSGNIASLHGGGVFAEESEVSFAHSQFISNKAVTGAGGGLYLYSPHQYWLCPFSNCLVTGNSARRGGGIYLYHHQTDILESTISGNRSEETGGGVLCSSGSGFIRNSIFWDNSPWQISMWGNQSGVSITWSDIGGGNDSIQTQSSNQVNWLEGNIIEDPQFSNTGESPFMLTANSPCRNAGTPDTAGLFLPARDLGDNPRIWEDRIDMGAYEWNNVGISDFRFRISDLGFGVFPNPFRETTNIYFRLMEGAQVKVSVFNNIGQLVDEMVEAFFSEGEYTVSWNPGGLPEGIYLCRIQTGRSHQTCKVIINK